MGETMQPKLYAMTEDGKWFELTNISHLPTLTRVKKRKRPNIYKKYSKPTIRTITFNGEFKG